MFVLLLCNVSSSVKSLLDPEAMAAVTLGDEKRRPVTRERTDRSVTGLSKPLALRLKRLAAVQTTGS